jgi:hypothetical protein
MLEVIKLPGPVLVLVMELLIVVEELDMVDLVALEVEEERAEEHMVHLRNQLCLVVEAEAVSQDMAELVEAR